MEARRTFDFELNAGLNVPMSDVERIEMPEPDRSSHEHAALQRLLRRRGRRGKSGANTGEETRLYAWHSSYSQQPGSDHSIGVRLLQLFGLLVALASPFLVALAWSLHEFVWYWQSDAADVFFAFLYGCMILIIGTILIAPILLIALPLVGAWESWRQRRHQAAMPPRDGAGVGTVAAAENSAERDGL